MNSSGGAGGVSSAFGVGSGVSLGFAGLLIWFDFSVAATAEVIIIIMAISDTVITKATATAITKVITDMASTVTTRPEATVITAPADITTITANTVNRANTKPDRVTITDLRPTRNRSLRNFVIWCFHN